MHHFQSMQVTNKDNIDKFIKYTHKPIISIYFTKTIHTSCLYIHYHYEIPFSYIEMSTHTAMFSHFSGISQLSQGL